VSSKIGADLRRAGACLALVAALFAPTLARAQATDAAMAQSLFDEGRKLMNDKKYAEACPKLAESQRLDPALGTLLNLAVCHERSGRTATSWSELRDVVSLARRENRPERERYAREHIAALEPKLSRLTIARSAGATDSVEVRLDDALFGEGALGTAVTIDPGAHRIEARAPGKKPWKTEITIGANADRKVVEIPPLDPEPKPLASAPPPPPPPIAREPPPPAPAPGGGKTAGFVLGGLGLVALGVGAVAGIEAIAKWNDRTDHCPKDACDAAGLDADKVARRWALLADVGVGVGVVGVAVGAIFLVSGSKTSAGRVDVSPRIGAHHAGLAASITW